MLRLRQRSLLMMLLLSSSLTWTMVMLRSTRHTQHGRASNKVRSADILSWGSTGYESFSYCSCSEKSRPKKNFVRKVSTDLHREIVVFCSNYYAHCENYETIYNSFQ
jgi:hypothetical protein